MPQPFIVEVVNEAGLPDQEVRSFVATADEWVRRYIVPFWPMVNGSAVRSHGGNAQLVIARDVTQANSLGYHILSSQGYPVGIVEMDAVKNFQQSWTTVATHEIGELLINPKLDYFVALGQRQYPVEICDPVTADPFSMNGLLVSNAVTPAFWQARHQPGNRYDIRAHVSVPIPNIPPNGWMEWYEGGKWQSAYGKGMPKSVVHFMKARRRSAASRRWHIRKKF